MIKIRLEGTPEEVDKAIVHLEADDRAEYFQYFRLLPEHTRKKKRMRPHLYRRRACAG